MTKQIIHYILLQFLLMKLCFKKKTEKIKEKKVKREERQTGSQTPAPALQSLIDLRKAVSAHLSLLAASSASTVTWGKETVTPAPHKCVINLIDRCEVYIVGKRFCWPSSPLANGELSLVLAKLSLNTICSPHFIRKYTQPHRTTGWKLGPVCQLRTSTAPKQSQPRLYLLLEPFKVTVEVSSTEESHLLTEQTQSTSAVLQSGDSRKALLQYREQTRNQGPSTAQQHSTYLVHTRLSLGSTSTTKN